MPLPAWVSEISSTAARVRCRGASGSAWGSPRALAGSRNVLIADEPTGALDSATSAALFELVAQLCHERGVTALVATHDPIARDYADSVLTMCDGRVQAAT